MREIGMLFSAPMVRALLANKKTMTRRTKFKGSVGDRIWVKESFQPLFDGEYPPENLDYKTGAGYHVSYPATDGTREFFDCSKQDLSERVKPSIHMPKWAARIWLEITWVEAQRLQEITGEDAKAEGIEQRNEEPAYWLYGQGGFAEHWTASPIASFASLWESIHGKGAWEKNPFVCKITFRRIER